MQQLTCTDDLSDWCWTTPTCIFLFLLTPLKFDGCILDFLTLMPIKVCLMDIIKKYRFFSLFHIRVFKGMYSPTLCRQADSIFHLTTKGPSVSRCPMWRATIVQCCRSAKAEVSLTWCGLYLLLIWCFIVDHSQSGYWPKESRGTACSQRL